MKGKATKNEERKTNKATRRPVRRRDPDPKVERSKNSSGRQAFTESPIRFFVFRFSLQVPFRLSDLASPVPLLCFTKPSGRRYCEDARDAGGRGTVCPVLEVKMEEVGTTLVRMEGMLSSVHQMVVALDQRKHWTISISGSTGWNCASTNSTTEPSNYSCGSSAFR